MQKMFQTLARWVSFAAGTTSAFVIALLIVVVWVIIGPLFHFSDTWQLMISTISSIVTFLMVFLIQYSQNKDTKALHVKLDELIKSSTSASDKFVDIEEKPDIVIEKAKEKVSKEVKKKKKNYH